MRMTALVIAGMREIDLMTESLPLLDALGDCDFALAREQRHRAHLAQVHADGIVGLVERAGREVELGAFAFRAFLALHAFAFALVALFRVDQVDAGAARTRASSSSRSSGVAVRSAGSRSLTSS